MILYGASDISMLKNSPQLFAFKIKFVYEMSAVSSELSNREFLLVKIFWEAKYTFDPST